MYRLTLANSTNGGVMVVAGLTLVLPMVAGLPSRLERALPHHKGVMPDSLASPRKT